MFGLPLWLHILWFLAGPSAGPALLYQPQRAWPAAQVLEELADQFNDPELLGLLGQLEVRGSLDAPARDRLRAALLLRQGEAARAEELLFAQGLVRSWTVLLPQQLAGVKVQAPRGDPRASLAELPTRNLDSSPILETSPALPPLPMLYLEAQGQGLSELELSAPGQRLRLLPQPTRPRLSYCGPNPGKGLRLRLTLAPYGAALPFSVRATTLGQCPPGEAPDGGPFGLFLSHLEDDSAQLPSDQEILALAPGPLEFRLLQLALPERVDLLDRLCTRLPWCGALAPAQILAAQAHWDRGQTFLASLKLGLLPAPGSTQPPPWLIRLRHRLAAELHLSLNLPGAALAGLRASPSPPAPEDLDLWIAAALALADQGALREAAGLALRSYPGHAGLRSAAAAGLTELGLRQEALDLLDQDAPPGLRWALRFQRARLLRELGRPQDYRRALEETLTQSPADDQALRLLLEFCAANSDDPCLQQTSTRLEALQAAEPQGRAGAFLPAQRTWKGLALSLAEVAALPRVKASAFLADTWWISVGAGGLRSLHRQQVLEIQGRPDQDLRLGAWYDSHTEDLETLESLLLRPNGRVQPAGEADDSSLGDDEYNSYYDLRHRTQTFRGLQPGDRVVWTWRLVQHRNAGAGFSLFRFLQDELPKVRLHLTVSAPTGLGLRHALLWPLPGEAPVFEASTADSKDLLRLDLTDLPALPTPPFPAPDTQRAAILILGRSEGWDSLLRWYHGLIQPLSVPGPGVLALVEESLAQGLSRQQLLAELTRRVSDEVRYVAMEIGVNAFVPYDINLTLERLFGDCKDQSLLLAAALSAAGIEAVPAVIRTAPRGPLGEVPVSIALFDHAVVFLPGDNLFLDPTVPFLGLGSLPWQDQGALALPILPGLDQPLAIPIDGAPVNTEELTLDLAPGGPRGLVISGQFSATGTRARARLRALTDPEGTRALGLELLGRFFTVDQLSLARASLERQGAGRALLDLEARGAFRSRGLAPGLRFQGTLAAPNSRAEALLLPFPFVDRVTLRAGFDAFLPAPRVSQSSPHCAWTLEVTPRTLSLELTVPERQIEVAAYPDFRACLGALDRALAATRLQPGGPP